MDESIFYVGITKIKLGTRLSQHLTEARRGNRDPKCEIIRNILRNDLRPLIVLHEAEGSYKKEVEKIKAMILAGHKLSNIKGNNKFQNYTGIADTGFKRQWKRNLT